jgi:hypothetical protein
MSFCLHGRFDPNRKSQQTTKIVHSNTSKANMLNPVKRPIGAISQTKLFIMNELILTEIDLVTPPWLSCID